MIDPFAAGLTAGAIHHFALQYPTQAQLFTSLYAFALTNVIFLILLFTTKDHFRETNGTFKDICIFDFAYCLNALLLKTVYNVYFRHCGIPTDFWHGASDWTSWRNHRYKKPYEVIAQLHRQFGDVTRIAPNHISFNDINAIEDIYGHHTKSEKGDRYAMMNQFSKAPSSIVSERDKIRHGFLRRVMNPAFGPKSLQAMEVTVIPYCHQLLNCIDKQIQETGEIVDMSEWFYNLSFDISGALNLGSDFGNLRTGETHFFVKAVHRSFAFLSLFHPIPWLAPILKCVPSTQALKNTREHVRAYSRNAVSQCLERNKVSEEKNILGSIGRAQDRKTGQRLSFDELLINAITLLLGGADTTAIALTFGLYYIVSIPKVWSRLSQEIRSSFETSEDITVSSSQQLQYLNAVIHESLRIRPVVTGGQNRVTPPEGMIIGGRFICGGTVVSCPNWTMLHDPRYFSNPESFIPERWIESECGTETCVKQAWIPFSYGKWSCIGKPLALMELRLIFAKLIWNYDMTLKSHGQEAPTFDHLGIRSGPLEVRLRRVIERN